MIYCLNKSGILITLQNWERSAVAETSSTAKNVLSVSLIRKYLEDPEVDLSMLSLSTVPAYPRAVYETECPDSIKRTGREAVQPGFSSVDSPSLSTVRFSFRNSYFA